MVINVNNTFEWSPDELYHHGILGMKWGRRRWQNSDGTLTEAGKRRYGTVEEFDRRTKKLKDMTDRELQLNLDRQRKINEYKRLTRSPLVDKALDTVKAISENRNRRREQVLKDKELAVRAKESEDAKKIAKYKKGEARSEFKTYKTEAKRWETKSEYKNAKANLKRAKSEHKKLSLFSFIKRLKENQAVADIDSAKHRNTIERLIKENEGKKIEETKTYWNAQAENFKAEQSRWRNIGMTASKEKNDNNSGNKQSKKVNQNNSKSERVVSGALPAGQQRKSAFSVSSKQQSGYAAWAQRASQKAQARAEKKAANAEKKARRGQKAVDRMMRQEAGYAEYNRRNKYTSRGASVVSGYLLSGGAIPVEGMVY